MMKKVIPLLFIILCLALCVIPSAGMIIAPSDEPIGNEKTTSFPSWQTGDGSFNPEYFTQAGKYFETHFALRGAAIDADARLMSGIFETSNIDSVTVGSDGWLYYSSTLPDYRGENVFTERETADLVRNLDIVRRYAKSQGVDFLFTVAPNKNTLYPAHMPYYQTARGGRRNRDLVAERLSDSKINYVDLFTLFEEQDEELYFARDSHWNNKGALLVYNEVMTALKKEHDDYSSADVSRKKDFHGDLAAMLYPNGAEPEYNYYYGAEDKYTYVTDTKSVEDSYIETENPDADGKLYMYRDSFGNSLLPFFASAYGKAAFTKSFPMILEYDLKTTKPDVFIMELVERNLDWMISRPPVVPSPRKKAVVTTPYPESAAFTVDAAPCQYSPAYLEFSGTVDSSALDPDDVIYVSVTDHNGKTALYQCYGLTADEDGKTGFAAYTEADRYDLSKGLDISVIIDKRGEFYELGSENIRSGGKNEK